VDDREAPLDVAAEARDEAGGVGGAAGLGGHDDEDAAGGLGRRHLGSQQREHERQGEDWTDCRPDHARHIGMSSGTFSDS
jgi:hypothetical protein